MKKLFLLSTILAGFFFACNEKKEANKFLLAKDRVGFLTREVQVRQLDSVFKGDSIVPETSEGLFGGGQNRFMVYDKSGKPLLLLDPVQAFDTTSTIGNIRVIDKRYKTGTGIGASSTFGEILANYEISRIENTLDAAVVFIDEINAYVTFDKALLPEKFQNNTNLEIKSPHIPENAPIEYFWIGWE